MKLLIIYVLFLYAKLSLNSSNLERILESLLLDFNLGLIY
jgi:hypothetical protein